MNAGKRIFTAVLASGRAPLLVGANAVFPWDPASLAGKLLLNGLALVRSFPPGLEAMRPRGDFIGPLENVSEPFSLRTWGAECDLNKLPSGTLAFIKQEVIRGLFSGAANDTVVPTASAIGAGAPGRVLRECTHFEYFLQPEIQQELRNLA